MRFGGMQSFSSSVHLSSSEIYTRFGGHAGLFFSSSSEFQPRFPVSPVSTKSTVRTNENAFSRGLGD